VEYRSLGQTGLKLSSLSFGASSLGAEFRPVDINEANGVELGLVDGLDTCRHHLFWVDHTRPVSVNESASIK
jgi:hypothetical protein